MNLLLLGARGMLGTAFAELLAAKQPAGKVALWDKEELDITDAGAVSKALAEQKPEIVINCAAYTDVDGAETNEALANRINGDAVGLLAAASKKVGATLVHFSTDYVFDGRNASGYPEDAEPDPLNAYGRSKALGERLLRENTDRFYLIRSSWLFGKHGKNFVTTMLDLGRSKPSVRVVNDQHGKPTYTRDLVAFTLKLMDEKAPFGVYHGANEPVTTWFDFAREIFRVGGVRTSLVPCTSEEYPRLAKRPQWSALLNTKRPLLRPRQEALYDYLQELRVNSE